MTIQSWLQIITSTISLIGVMFLIYHFFRNPDIKADKDLSLLKQGCNLTHSNLDRQILEINNRFERIENNHINHIEKDIRDINNTQTKILTILEAKYQIKINEN